MNFRPEGDLITDEEMNKNAGLYYKFRTRSSNVPTMEVEASTGKRRMVYHLDRFIPVFSYRFWDTKKLDAASNYTYFYPNSTWKGTGGFNVSNAAVSEYEILADNGYVYIVDQVIEPLETIYTQLESNENYSIFSTYIMKIPLIRMTLPYLKILEQPWGPIHFLFIHMVLLCLL